jgi:hypothetical protein
LEGADLTDIHRQEAVQAWGELTQSAAQSELAAGD